VHQKYAIYGLCMDTAWQADLRLPDFTRYERRQLLPLVETHCFQRPLCLAPGCSADFADHERRRPAETTAIDSNTICGKRLARNTALTFLRWPIDPDVLCHKLGCEFVDHLL